LVSDIPAGDGNVANLFFQCKFQQSLSAVTQGIYLGVALIENVYREPEEGLEGPVL
jgi:hypothetical protein